MRDGLGAEFSETEVPEEIRNLPGPVIGFVGALSDYKIEFSRFTREMSHKHDDQIAPTPDAIAVMLTQGVDLYAGAIR